MRLCARGASTLTTSWSRPDSLYSAARDRYEDAVLLTGYPTGTPQEALDTACTLYLAGLGHEPDSEPPTNLRCHPLSYPVSRRWRCGRSS